MFDGMSHAKSKGGKETCNSVSPFPGPQNLSVVVEASASLPNPVWQPLQTNALNNGVVNFFDTEWTNYPNRFYRVRSQ